MSFEFSTEDQSELLKTARRALAEPGWVPGFEDVQSPNLRKSFPCFVTLLRSDGSLRGCIGTLESEDAIGINVAQYAHLAAHNDPRFPTVSSHEIPSLLIEISILGPCRPLPSLEHLEIGRHGLVVQKGPKKGVLLAQVASEQEWDKQEFLEQTCFKAGLRPEQADQYEKFYFDEIHFSESPAPAPSPEK